jgi:hypothetical protein
MKVMYFSHVGAGSAGTLEIEDGMTLKDFFINQMGETVNINQYTVRINKQSPSNYDVVLNEGDRISVTPTKIAGAL